MVTETAVKVAPPDSAQGGGTSLELPAAPLPAGRDQAEHRGRGGEGGGSTPGLANRQKATTAAVLPDSFYRGR